MAQRQIVEIAEEECACLGACPRGAIRIITREAAEFDEEAAGLGVSSPGDAVHTCPGAAPFFEGADLLIAADCVPFALPDFHSRVLRGRREAQAPRGRAVAESRSATAQGGQ